MEIFFGGVFSRDGILLIEGLGDGGISVGTFALATDLTSEGIHSVHCRRFSTGGGCGVREA